jgi:hypothetical protein
MSPRRWFVKGITVGYLFGSGIIWGAIGMTATASAHIAVGCVIFISTLRRIKAQENAQEKL